MKQAKHVIGQLSWTLINCWKTCKRKNLCALYIPFLLMNAKVPQKQKIFYSSVNLVNFKADFQVIFPKQAFF
jgi:hypothetical protein